MINNISLNLQNKLRSNIWKFAIHSITKKRTFMPFFAIYLLTFPNTTVKTIGLLTFIGQIAGFILEIPSGYISDKIGHKNTLVIARVITILSTACFTFANDKVWFAIGSIFLSVSIALMSGTESAFMHNTFTSLKISNKYSHIMGKIRSVGFAIPIIFILTLSFIAETSFKNAMMVALLIDIIGLISVISMKTPPDSNKNTEEIGINNINKIIKKFKKIGWLPYIVVVAIGFGIVSGSTMGFKNTYQESLGFSISMLGILWSVSRILIASLLYINGWIYKTFSFKQFIIIRLCIYGVSFLGIGLFNNMWIVATLFILANVTTWGVLSSESHYFLDFIKESKHKATLLSVRPFIDKIISAVVGLGMGYMIMSSSYMKAYFIVGATLIFTTLLTTLFIKKQTLVNKNKI